LILPHTDLEGAHAIAERIREAVEELRVPRIDGTGVLRITASVGVTASTVGPKDALIAEADGALYEAKRAGEGTARSARQLEPRTLRGPGTLKRPWAYLTTRSASIST
jgi:diguanylate cyclase (GGDEF)-like protein